MNITHALLSLPTYLLLLLMLIFFAVISVVITWFCHRYLRLKIMAAHNEITGIFFSVVAGFYALILAFVVFQALDEFNGVQRDADMEGSLAKSLYRQIKYYPDTADVVALKKEYLNYVNLVTGEEYPNMEQMKKSDTTVATFGKVFEMIEKLKPTETNTQAKAQVMFQHLGEMAKYRSLRMLAGNSEIPLIMWLVLLTGGFITLLLAAMLNMENHRYHLLVNGMMGAFLGLVFFLIIILDHPFTGTMKVEPTGYDAIISMDKITGVGK